MPAPVMATNTTLDGTQSDGGPVRKIIVETDDSGKTIGSHEEKPVPTGVDFFKKMKRTTDAKINIKFVEKIPNVDFIKMMDENFDQGVLDYLVQNITDNIIAAPNIIHNQVRAQLHDMVYAKKDKVKKNAAQDQK